MNFALQRLNKIYEFRLTRSEARAVWYPVINTSFVIPAYLVAQH